MRDLNDLAVFAAVVERRGFTAAADSLGVAKSFVSQRIARLEARLGVRLIHRTTRKQHVTEIGMRYYHHCRQMLEQAERAQRVVDDASGEPTGELRVAAPALFSQLILGPIAAQFLSAFPQVRLQLETLDRGVDIIEEGYDVVFGVRDHIDDSTLVVRSFGVGLQMLVASPRLLRQHARLRRPADLVRFPSVALAMWADGGRHYWRLRNARGQRRNVEHHPRFVTDDVVALQHAAVNAVGLASLPDFLCVDELARGRLERVLPTWEAAAGNVHALYPSRQGQLPVVRAFLDFVTPRIEARLPELARGVGAAQEPRR